jgi:hypothetical protein
MSESAASTAVGQGRLVEPADPYLCHWDANAKQRRWVLPINGGIVTIGHPRPLTSASRGTRRCPGCTSRWSASASNG